MNYERKTNTKNDSQYIESRPNIYSIYYFLSFDN